jgi:protein-S-isoprenylcysteine O-methyltransferase Ste14
MLEKSGNQLFRYRGQIPLILVGIAILVIYFNHELTFFEYLFGKKITIGLTLGFIFFGHLIRFLVVGVRGVHTSGQNRHEQVAEMLNTTGLYSIVRHPLYVGNFFIWIGVFVWLGDPWFFFVGCSFFILLYVPIMKLENSFLADKFGKKYGEWSAKTPMFIPKFRLFQKSSIPFSVKLVWKNEYPGIVSTLSSLWFISFMRLQFLEGKITISLPLFFFATMILVFGLSSRYLKHRTQFFPKMG